MSIYVLENTSEIVVANAIWLQSSQHISLHKCLQLKLRCNRQQGSTLPPRPYSFAELFTQDLICMEFHTESAQRTTRCSLLLMLNECWKHFYCILSSPDVTIIGINLVIQNAWRIDCTKSQVHKFQNIKMCHCWVILGKKCLGCTSVNRINKQLAYVLFVLLTW